MSAKETYNGRDWDSHPPYIFPDYKSTPVRGPTKAPVKIRQTLSELTGPLYGGEAVRDLDNDLTRNSTKNGAPLGERILVAGQVVDENGKAVPNALLEIWQCNAAGRYNHERDQHDAPLDPNFRGSGRCVTDAEGRYRFHTIKPGAYPWPNHRNAWRPAHIHFSIFGTGLLTRLVTQMYFPADPLLALDPIYHSAPAGARERLVADFRIGLTEPEFALGYEWNICLRGRSGTPMEG